MDKYPKVSVLMSCYNASRWLSEAIESVMNQSFSDFEFIIVDDGSSDDTNSIITHYGDMDSRIRPIFKNNTGLAESLNKGISIARGEWIARIDADDICEMNRLEKQINYVKLFTDTVLLGSAYWEINENGNIVSKQSYPTDHNTLVKNLMRLRRFFPHSSAFYKTELAIKVGGYNPRILRAEDWRFWLALSMYGKINCLDEPLVRVRKHSKQISFMDRNSEVDLGRRQIYDSVAATVCHYLQIRGKVDVSISLTDKEWNKFLSWIEQEVTTSGLISRIKSRSIAKSKFENSKNRLVGMILFLWNLLKSPHLIKSINERLFGCSLPSTLAQKWTKITNL